MDRLTLTRLAEANHFWFRGFRRYVAPVVADLAAGRPDLRLIDCGCGTGANLALLSSHGRAFGFDLVRHELALAVASKGVPAAQGDITRIPFASGRFDIVTAFDVLQVVPDDRAAVAEMARLLTPGGSAVATVAAFDLLRGDHAEVWHEVRRYTPASVRQLFAGTGLRVQRVSFMFASIFPLMLAVRISQRLLRPYRTLRADTDIAVPMAPVNALLSGVVSGEAALARRIPMPIGSSLLVVATKD